MTIKEVITKDEMSWSLKKSSQLILPERIDGEYTYIFSSFASEDDQGFISRGGGGGGVDREQELISVANIHIDVGFEKLYHLFRTNEIVTCCLVLIVLYDFWTQFSSVTNVMCLEFLKIFH